MFFFGGELSPCQKDSCERRHVMESCQVTGWNALEMADSVMKNAKAITNGENNSAFIPCSNDHRDHLLNAAFLCNQLS